MLIRLSRLLMGRRFLLVVWKMVSLCTRKWFGFLRNTLLITFVPPTVIFGNTESSTSPYSYTASRIIINPTGSNTLSQNDRVRLAVGTQPRYIKKNEEWGGKKVADFIVFGENPRMKVLGTTKINFAQGF